MRQLTLSTLLALLPFFLTTTALHAKEKTAVLAAPAAPDVHFWDRQQAVKAAKVFDKDHNGKIEGEEAEKLRAAFNKKPDGYLKFYDLNKDGKLDDVEISLIHTPGPKAPKKAKKSRSFGL